MTKITYGYVEQEYNIMGKCIRQRFVAGMSVIGEVGHLRK